MTDHSMRATDNNRKKFRSLAISDSRAVGTYIAYPDDRVRDSIGMEADKDDNVILTQLKGRKRWIFLATEHPIEFISIVAGIAAAWYLFVGYLLSVARYILYIVVGSAHADEYGKFISIGGQEISLEATIIVPLIILMFWFVVIFQTTSSPKRMESARESIRYLIGFFVGLLGGKTTLK